MDILLAAMAFAVLMVIFSTAVTAITETYLRITATRADVLAQSTLKFLEQDPTIRNTIKAGLDRFDATWIDPAIDALRANAKAWLGSSEGKRVLTRLKEFETLLAKIAADPDSDDAAKATASQAAYDDLDGAVKSALATALRHLAHEALVKNPAMREATGAVGRFGRWLLHTVQGNSKDRIDTLSTYSFLQRLATTEIGQKVAGDAEEYALRGLTMGYERFIAASNEVFRKHAQAVTMVLSIGFAFVLNIEATRLFSYLIQNPTISAEIIDGVEDAVEVNQARLEGLAAGMKGLEDGADAASDAETGSGDNAETTEEAPPEDPDVEQTGVGAAPPAPVTTTDPDAVSGDAVPDVLATADAQLRTALDQLATLRSGNDLPIGWDQFPYNQDRCTFFPGPCAWMRTLLDRITGQPSDGTGTDSAESAAQAAQVAKVAPSDTIAEKEDYSFRDLVPWFVNVVLAGFLIGLGGPFWYKVFTSLSHVVQLLRTFRGQPREESIGKSDSDQQRASQPLVAAVGTIDETSGKHLVNLFRAAAGLPPVPDPAEGAEAPKPAPAD